MTMVDVVRGIRRPGAADDVHPDHRQHRGLRAGLHPIVGVARVEAGTIAFIWMNVLASAKLDDSIHDVLISMASASESITGGWPLRGGKVRDGVEIGLGHGELRAGWDGGTLHRAVQGEDVVHGEGVVDQRAVLCHQDVAVRLSLLGLREVPEQVERL